MVAIEVGRRLGFLLKHAQHEFASISESELSAVGITGRECAVLLTVDDRAPVSQQEAATRLGIDRSTMVQLLDGLEARGLVARRPDAADRRRNAVELTANGRRTLGAALEATDRAESRFLAALDDPDAFRRALAAVVKVPGADS